MCRRRLAREHHGGKRFGNRAADARFAVQNRLVADARLAHAAEHEVRAAAFVDPADLEPEQRRLYRAAVQGYLAAFGDRPGLSADLGWRTPLPALGVELVGDVGIALDLADGGRELRIVKLGGRRTGAPLLDPVELRCALVRSEAWAPDHVRIVVADLLEQEVVEHVPDVAAERLEAHAWITGRVDTIVRNAADGRAKPGGDCSGCGFVAGCAAHG